MNDWNHWKLLLNCSTSSFISKWCDNGFLAMDWGTTEKLFSQGGNLKVISVVPSVLPSNHHCINLLTRAFSVVLHFKVISWFLPSLAFFFFLLKRFSRGYIPRIQPPFPVPVSLMLDLWEKPEARMMKNIFRYHTVC